MYKTHSVRAQRDVKKGHFGATEITEVFHEDDVAKVTKQVYLPGKDFIRDYERQTRALH